MCIGFGFIYGLGTGMVICTIFFIFVFVLVLFCFDKLHCFQFMKIYWFSFILSHIYRNDQNESTTKPKWSFLWSSTFASYEWLEFWWLMSSTVNINDDDDDNDFLQTHTTCGCDSIDIQRIFFSFCFEFRLFVFVWKFFSFYFKHFLIVIYLFSFSWILYADMSKQGFQQWNLKFRKSEEKNFIV